MLNYAMHKLKFLRHYNHCFVQPLFIYTNSHQGLKSLLYTHISIWDFFPLLKELQLAFFYAQSGDNISLVLYFWIAHYFILIFIEYFSWL